MSYYTYVTFDAIQKNFESLGMTFDLFDKSTIVQSFISNNIIDASTRVTSIFLRRYRLRFYYYAVLVQNDSVDYETLYNTIKNYISDIDFELKYKYDKLIKTLSFEYNPIWNKDGTITHNYKRTPDLSTAETQSGGSNLQHGLTVTTTPDLTTTETGSGETTETPNTTTKVSGTGSETTTPNLDTTTTNSVVTYDGGSAQLHDTSDEKQTGTQEVSTSGDTTTTNSGTTTTETSDSRTTTEGGKTTTSNSGIDATTTTGNLNRTETGTDTIEETTLEQGNIGVTTTQSMIREEREISDYSIIDTYLKDIVNYICLATYKIN